MKIITNLGVILILLLCISCISRPHDDAFFTDPPVSVLDQIPSHFESLKSGMTEDQIFDTLGLSPYKEHMLYRTEIAVWCIGIYSHDWRFGDGYELGIDTAENKVTVRFVSPKLQNPITKTLGSE